MQSLVEKCDLNHIHGQIYYISPIYGRDDLFINTPPVHFVHSIMVIMGMFGKEIYVS